MLVIAPLKLPPEFAERIDEKLRALQVLAGEDPESRRLTTSNLMRFLLEEGLKAIQGREEFALSSILENGLVRGRRREA